MSVAPVHFAMLSHQGRVRKSNEDTCAAAPDYGAFVVCDGMGGAAAGEVASSLAAQAFLKALNPPRPPAGPRTATPDVRMNAAVHAANHAVFLHSRRSRQLDGMGTTLVALLVEPAAVGGLPSMTLAHVGDSRCYLYRDGLLRRLTDDHSLVEEQMRAGELSAAEALTHPMRNIITRAVGSQAEVEPEIVHVAPHSGDLYLLASDGLTRELSDPQIRETLHRAFSREYFRRRPEQTQLESLCKTLIDQANDAGGGDNITVLLLRVC